MGRVEFACLLAEADDRYRAACRSAQQLDPVALLEKTLELLESDAGAHVLQALVGRFRFLFIDEFQDTNNTKAEIVDLLAPQKKVMVVGDKKQSIYAFAGAIVALLNASLPMTTPLPATADVRASNVPCWTRKLHCSRRWGRTSRSWMSLCSRMRTTIRPTTRCPRSPSFWNPST